MCLISPLFMPMLHLKESFIWLSMFYNQSGTWNECIWSPLSNKGTVAHISCWQAPWVQIIYKDHELANYSQPGLDTSCILRALSRRGRRMLLPFSTSCPINLSLNACPAAVFYIVSLHITALMTGYATPQAKRLRAISLEVNCLKIMIQAGIGIQIKATMTTILPYVLSEVCRNYEKAMCD